MAPPQNSSATPYKSKKKFLQNWACSVLKEAEFCADLKNVQNSQVWQEGKTFFTEKLNF
jgi:hypothetical protein